MRIKKGDKVIVIKGRERGKSGLVIGIDKIAQRVQVEGLNIRKRHLKKSSRAGSPGGITEIAGTMNAANVMLADPTTGKPTRIGHTTVGGKKTRTAKKSQTVIEDVKR